MWLKFIDVDESFPYHVFKKGNRNRLHSRDRYLDNKHFFKRVQASTL